MANPTTNYSFAMPTNTDLVKDLPADFDIFGQAVDDRIKALNPSTTLGDIEYRSSTANTNTRLAIGTTGQVLTVSGGVPSWAAAPSSSGPAFRVYGSGNQSISSATATKIQWDSETFDTDNCFDSTTNYRFTPTKSGYYQITMGIRSTWGGGNAYFEMNLYKNGANDAIIITNPSSPSGIVNGGAILVYMNGTTDYLEVYLYSGGTSPIIDRANSYFTGVWIRS
jgi:hypothetical protein